MIRSDFPRSCDRVERDWAAANAIRRSRRTCICLAGSRPPDRSLPFRNSAGFTIDMSAAQRNQLSSALLNSAACYALHAFADARGS